MSIEPNIRRGVPADAHACHQILWEAATDLGARRGTPLSGSAEDWWRTSGPLHQHLTEHHAEWWVAEEPNSERLVGYARSVEREGMIELTEFFVRPGEQSRGVGQALLERAFPPDRGEVRSIIATTDVRALARYYEAGTVARFPMFTLAGDPSPAKTVSDLDMAPMDVTAIARATAIERAVLEFGRSEDEFAWLLSQRNGFFFRRGNSEIGFGFLGKAGAGPVAVLDPADLTDVLLLVEDRAYAMGLESLELEVPAINVTAMWHLLGRGFRFDPWVNLLMSNRPFGQFDRYIGYSPPIFL